MSGLRVAFTGRARRRSRGVCVVFCHSCAEKRLEERGAALIERIDLASPGFYARERLVCSRCGSRDVEMVVTGTERRT